jgi:Zn-dependent peptidase ImmA (M78 family)
MIANVPYLTKSAIEAEANALLAEFAREKYPVIAPPVPIDEIVELHLNLTFEIMDLQTLFGHGDIHGAIWFHEKRIAIDTQLDPEKNPAKRGRYHYTLAHETGHWWLHRKHFLLRNDQKSLFGEVASKPDVVCRSSDKKPIEWQADFFAAHLLMPRAMVKDAWEQWRCDTGPIALSDLSGEKQQQILTAELLRRGSMTMGADSHDDAILEHQSRPLAEQFQVSPGAMRIRLEDLGYLARKKEASLFD